MKTVKKEAFNVIGIKVRTTNKNGQSAKDIGQLWEKFISENIIDTIPNKIDSAILSIYTNYEGDHTQPYDTLLGCKVSTLSKIPTGMIGQKFKDGNYTKFTAQGDLSQGVVYQTWLEIWNETIDRTFTCDFEVYGEKAKHRSDAVVEIFVGTHK